MFLHTTPCFRHPFFTLQICQLSLCGHRLTTQIIYSLLWRLQVVANATRSSELLWIRKADRNSRSLLPHKPDNICRREKGLRSKFASAYKAYQNTLLSVCTFSSRVFLFYRNAIVCAQRPGWNVCPAMASSHCPGADAGLHRVPDTPTEKRALKKTQLGFTGRTRNRGSFYRSLRKTLPRCANNKSSLDHSVPRSCPVVLYSMGPSTPNAHSAQCSKPYCDSNVEQTLSLGYYIARGAWYSTHR